MSASEPSHLSTLDVRCSAFDVPPKAPLPIPAATEWRKFLPVEGQPIDPPPTEVCLWRCWHNDPENGDPFIDVGRVEWDHRHECYMVSTRSFGRYPAGPGVRWARIIPAPIPIPETATGIFVDDACAHGWVLRGRHTDSCHLFCSGPELLDLLHALALRIGLKRRWFQCPDNDASHRGRMPHYDCTPSRRTAAIQAGAVPLDRAGTVAIIRKWRALHAQRIAAEWARQWAEFTQAS